MKLGTKAETLKDIKPYLTNSHVPFFIVFNQLQVTNELNVVLNKILLNFTNRQIIIRSSSEYEDTANDSKAGCYLSIPLNITPSIFFPLPWKRAELRIYGWTELIISWFEWFLKIPTSKLRGEFLKLKPLL